ncbi:MAG: energy-coupling factor transporter transmembrane component T [Tissierellia bacterium]|nr:energy-coupling factor transporter transmembrane component T [Tissierellia bacterium]
MKNRLKTKYSLCPISKLLAILFLSFTISSSRSEIYNILIVVALAVLFILNGKFMTAIKALLFYLVLLALFNLYSENIFMNLLMMTIAMIKLFFLPLLAAKFLISTSDVSSMIISLEKLRFPDKLVIPIAVIFRYFPAFKEDTRNVKMAMKMRGISFKNPFKYFEYISIPILISAVNISDSISKAAETKCIADPCPKIRYKDVKMSLADIIFLVMIIGLHILGRIYD